MRLVDAVPLTDCVVEGVCVCVVDSVGEGVELMLGVGVRVLEPLTLCVSDALWVSERVCVVDGVADELAVPLLLGDPVKLSVIVWLTLRVAEALGVSVCVAVRVELGVLETLRVCVCEFDCDELGTCVLVLV